MPTNNNLDRLVAAGILEAQNLSQQDRATINDLTPDEVTTLIQIATRAYPDDRTAVQIANLRTGRLRIMFPL